MRVEYQQTMIRQQQEITALRMNMFDVDDPMLFVVPAAITDINTYVGTCNIVGCWGPEFDTDKLQQAGVDTVFIGQTDSVNQITKSIYENK